MEEKNAIKIL